MNQPARCHPPRRSGGGAFSRLLAVAVAAALVAALPAAVSAFDNVAIHGFLSQGFMDSQHYEYVAQSAEGTFHYSEMGVTISSQATDELRVGAQLFARELGELGRNRIELDWAYGDYAWRDWAGFRAGKIKMPYGFYNETRDVDALRTAVMLPPGVYDQRYRDLLVAVTGASLYGASPPVGLGSVEYQVYWGTTSQRPDGSVAQTLNASGPFTIDRFDVKHAGGAAVAWNVPRTGLRFGFTWNHFDWAADLAVDPTVYAMLQPLGAEPVETLRSKNTRLLTGSGEGMWGRWTVAAEWSVWKGDFENPFLGSELDQEGYYGRVSYRVNDWLEVGSYYSIFDDHDGVNTGGLGYAYEDYQKDLALSLRFDMSDYWIVKAEVHEIRGTGALLATDNLVTGGESWRVFAAKTSFVF